MAWFSFSKTGTGRRLTGLPRLTELLDRDFKRFFLANLLTLAGFIPFGAGVIFSLLSSSILVLIPSCLIGGALAGPVLSCHYDVIYRSLRDAPGRFWTNYKRAWKQNARASILPGMLFCLFIGFYLFTLMLFWWSSSSPSLGTLAVFFSSLLLFTMFFSSYWPQLILFEQTTSRRISNCILFVLRFFWKSLGCAILQIVYWIALLLLLPWSAILLLLTGFWLILFLSNFLMYRSIDEAFHLEEEIAKQFPEQRAFYEDDQEWVRRKQSEPND